MRRRLLAAIAGLCVLSGWGTYHLAMRGVVIHSLHSDPLATRYAGDLAHASGRMTAGFAVSPDGRFLAFDTQGARSYHTINVWDRWTERVTPAVSVQEIDPGSGSSHRYTWSVDSRALLISGSGKLPFGTPGKLCLVYIPQNAVLQEVTPCE